MTLFFRLLPRPGNILFARLDLRLAFSLSLAHLVPLDTSFVGVRLPRRWDAVTARPADDGVINRAWVGAVAIVESGHPSARQLPWGSRPR